MHGLLCLTRRYFNFRSIMLYISFHPGLTLGQQVNQIESTFKMFLHLNYDEYTCYFKAQTITVMFLYKSISGDSCQSPAFIDRNGSQLTTNNRVRLKASAQESVSYTACRVPPSAIQNSPSLDSFTRHWVITAIVFINIVSVFHGVSVCPVFIIFNAYLNHKNMFLSDC